MEEDKSMCHMAITMDAWFYYDLSPEWYAIQVIFLHCYGEISMAQYFDYRLMYSLDGMVYVYQFNPN